MPVRRGRSSSTVHGVGGRASASETVRVSGVRAAGIGNGRFLMAELKDHLLHYRLGERTLCGRRTYALNPERWSLLPSSEQCGHCRSALRRIGGLEGYAREAQEARRTAEEAEIAELSTLLDEVRAFARRVPVETRRQLAYQLRKAKEEIT